MLLLYLGQRFRLHLQIYFTFHYASTISNLTWEQYAVFLSLHSTMLLLYLFRLQSQSPIRHHFTFHYASTISTFRHIHPDPPSCFTFHYASTISGLFILVVFQVSLLYIPLCFYYIKEPSWMISIRLTTLHSTMLLLYLIPIIKSGICTSPLHSTMLLLYPQWTKLNRKKKSTLHSTMLLLYLNHHRLRAFLNYLYIPLCFYYIIRRGLGKAV